MKVFSQLGAKPLTRSFLASRPSSLVLLALLGLVASGCRRSRSPHIVPVVSETEFNGTPESADHVGVLRVGDRLLIEGFIFNNGSLTNPELDGFAFTAATPMHVDFRLFADNPFADLDVCLYDPAIDDTLACFATPNDPELGGVDVFAGGLDFHLVVESFTGDSTYTLEIFADPLFAAANAEDGERLEEADGELLQASVGLSAVGANLAADRSEPRARELYRAAQPAGETRPKVVIEERSVLHIDEQSGTVLMLTQQEITEK